MNGLFKKMDAVIVTVEEIKSFYPLLPEEYQKEDIEEEFIILGAVGEDSEGIYHAVGTMVLKAVHEDTLLLQWMLVAPNAQRQRAGYVMMELARQIAREMQMQILGSFSQKAGEKKEGAFYHFLKHNHFTIYNEGAKSFSISLEQLSKEAFFKKQAKGSGYLPLGEASTVMIMELNHRLWEKGLLLAGPISREECMADISMVHEEHGRIEACIIFRGIKEDVIELSFLYAGSKGSVHMPLLLLHGYQNLKEKVEPKTRLLIPCVTEVSCKLVETLAPSAEVILESYRMQWVPEEL